MDKIKVSFDNKSYQSKPIDREISIINNRITKNTKVLDSPASIYSFMVDVGQNGHTFCPATFINNKRNLANFEQIQLLVLDFDDTISFEAICNRTKQYELPILFAYESFSSIKQNRFRIIFLNNISIDNEIAAKIYKKALMTIFPEADSHDSNVVAMYFGGKKLLYCDKSLPTVDLELIIRNMTYWLKNKYGVTHYKRYIKKFAEENEIRLNKKGLLDVISCASNDTELSGTSFFGKNLPNAIIFYTSNGNFLPSSYYMLHLKKRGTNSSVEKKEKKKRTKYRKDALNEMNDKCQLYKEFVSAKRRLRHKELFGVATNIIQVELGISKFKKTISENPEYYDTKKQENWEYYLSYFKDENYKPQNCSFFCDYKDICNHMNNILSTIRPERGTMEKLSNYNEVYYPIEEVQEDLAKNLHQAINADDTKWHIIKAQTAAGKTEAFLNLMKNSDNQKFLIAVPTNKLKQDIKSRADKKGIDLMVTPSLDEIKDEIPDYIWDHIQFLRNTGQHARVHLFINRIAEEENIVCLKKYLKKQEKFDNYNGHTITTHRKLLNMNKNTFNKYDVVIIDEDIVLSSIIPNQCEIPISVLKKILKKAVKKEKQGNHIYTKLIEKIKKLMKKIKNNTLFELFSFELKEDEEEDENQDDILALTDIPSFCLAKFFIYRKTSGEKDLSEDSIVFLKAYKFQNIKYIMVSATADKDICEYCFGKQNVKFYECKQSRYIGTLNQYFSESMSRQYIDKNPSILNRISNWSGFKSMITFKKYGIDDMYFGNAIGCDSLKGENIDVVGTPYQIDFLYKLTPFSFGLNIDGDAHMKSCLVVHNGYSFTFTTYETKHDILRKFHLWMIESELEQAVGRARLLRCNCTVNLFSNFPLKQAIMKKSEYNKN